MRRRFVLSLAWLGLQVLSCDAVTAPPTAPQPVASESSPEPGVVAAVREPEEAPVRPTAPADPEAAAIQAFLASRQTGLVATEVAELARAIVEESRRNAFDPQLVLAVMHVESRFYNFAVSNVGAMGLMQILPSTGQELAQRAGIPWRGPQTLFDPVVNVRLGIAYVRQLADRYDHLPTALAAYNWGPGHIDRRLRRGRPLPKTYSGLVLDAYATTRHVSRS